MSNGTRRYAILASGAFATRSAKTAHGVIAYGTDEIVAVVDPGHAGKRVRDVVAYLECDAPIVATLEDALAKNPTSLLIGVAPPGGALPSDWRAAIVRALESGVEVVNGLHQFFSHDVEFARAAERGGARIWDVRMPPAPRLFDGSAHRIGARVVLTVGTDCAVGKMTAALELTRAAAARGFRARFLATGQTGIVIAGGGVPVDRVISDFTTGAVEELVVASASDADLLFVEGQGGINHPAFAPVTLGLLFGAAPDALVLVHRAGRTAIDDFGTPLLALPAAVAQYESLAATVKPARVAGIALNTQDLDEPGARVAIEAARTETGLPCDDVVRNGPAALFDAMAGAFARKTPALAMVACATIATLAGCTKTTGTQSGGLHPWTVPGVLRIGSSDEPDNLNPMFAHTDATDQIDAFIFAPVFRYDARGEMVPELATEVPTYGNGGISPDSKTITLHWRRGVRWSDGAPLGPADLRFTWRAVLNKANNTKLTSGWDDIAAIDVPDDHTAVLHLKVPNADVLGLLGTGGAAYPPLPEHLLGKLPDLNRADFNAHPISSGPWLLATWNHGASLEFEPNPKYWRGPPKLQHLSWRIVPNPDTLLTQLQTHEVDLVSSVGEAQAARLNGIAGLRIARHPSANWRRLAINCKQPGLDDVAVRLAIAEAIDWDRLNATVYHGYNQRARSDIPPDSWAAPNVPAYPYNPVAARALLDSAGYRPGADGVRSSGTTALRFTISATNKPGNEQAEVQMQQQLHAVGIALTIKNFPASYLFAQNGPLYGGTYDLEWSIDTNAPDPDNQGSWSGDFVPPRGANTSFLKDPVITTTSDAAIRTFDRARRKALYQKEESRIHQLVPAVFFYWQTTTAAYDDDLRGYEPAEYITDNWNSWQWDNR